MDDLVLEKNQKKLEQYFIRARKLNCSLVYLSQSNFCCPKNDKNEFKLPNHKTIEYLTRFVPHDARI